MLKATTKHGTYYLIDLENMRAMRVRGESRNDMGDDGEWFDYWDIQTYDYDKYLNNESPLRSEPIVVGKSIFFYLTRPFGGYRISTDVVSIEETDNA